jgi:hypothetical protein
MPIPFVALRVSKSPNGNKIKVESQLPNKAEMALSSDKFLPSWEMKK